MKIFEDFEVINTQTIEVNGELLPISDSVLYEIGTNFSETYVCKIRYIDIYGEEPWVEFHITVQDVDILLSQEDIKYIVLKQ